MKNNNNDVGVVELAADYQESFEKMNHEYVSDPSKPKPRVVSPITVASQRPVTPVKSSSPIPTGRVRTPSPIASEIVFAFQEIKLELTPMPPNPIQRERSVSDKWKKTSMTDPLPKVCATASPN